MKHTHTLRALLQWGISEDRQALSLKPEAWVGIPSHKYDPAPPSLPIVLDADLMHLGQPVTDLYPRPVSSVPCHCKGEVSLEELNFNAFIQTLFFSSSLLLLFFFFFWFDDPKFGKREWGGGDGKRPLCVTVKYLSLNFQENVQTKPSESQLGRVAGASPNFR